MSCVFVEYKNAPNSNFQIKSIVIRTFRYSKRPPNSNRMNSLKQTCFLLILLVHSAVPKPAHHFTSKSKAAYGSCGYIQICKNDLSRLKLYIALDSEKSESKMRSSRHQRRRVINHRRRTKWNKRINKICCFTDCNKDDEREIRVIMDYDRDYRRYTIKNLIRRFGGSNKG